MFIAEEIDDDIAGQMGNLNISEEPTDGKKCRNCDLFVSFF